MKLVTILFDGMADHPDENGQTPMSLAFKPTTDSLARVSEVGLCHTVPEGFKPGSDVANLSVLGYDPHLSYSGRSPLEAISMGIALGKDSVTYRANLVTLSDDADYSEKTMLDYSAGEVSTEEARELIEYLSKEFASDPDFEGLELHAGVAYRHCLKREFGVTGAILTPPHDISDRKISEFLPSGTYAAQMRHVMERSYGLLASHPINLARIERGLRPANSLWLWGEGTKPDLPDFYASTGLRGAMISAVDLLKGIAIGAGMTSIDVEGATANIHTNFEGKAQAAIRALDEFDYVYLHLEAPDECGHQGDKDGKTRAIELIDEKAVTPVLAALRARGERFKILIMPDHATPYSLKTHTSEPVPYLIYDSEYEKVGVDSFTESSAAQTGIIIERAHDLINSMRNS